MTQNSSPRFTQILADFQVLDSRQSIIEKVENLLDSQSGGYFLALNPEKILSAFYNEEIKRILIHAKFLFIDGIGAKWAYKILLKKSFERVGGIDLVEKTLQLANLKRLKVGLLGAEEDVVQKTKQVMASKYPDINFVFSLSGFGAGLTEADDKMRQTNPNLVLVAMGSPTQEKWMDQYCRHYPSTLFTGVGGTFDVVSGKVRRAPVIFQKMGLEWLFRFLQQPIKRWKRISNLFHFMLLTIKDRIFS
jgi:N-acetylglucosaminyldiphosphoundecaprenol N-acetyl-beta-D-mannosaminyltransferase